MSLTACTTSTNYQAKQDTLICLGFCASVETQVEKGKQTNKKEQQ